MVCSSFAKYVSLTGVAVIGVVVVIDVDVLVAVVVEIIVVFTSAVDVGATVVDEWTAKTGSTFVGVVIVFFRRVTTISINRSVCLVCTVVGALVYVLMMPFLFTDTAGFSTPPF
jgi:hypothetical protein